MNPPLPLCQVSHAGCMSAPTGIQRVCRSFFEEFSARQPAVPFCYDLHPLGWRHLVPPRLRSGATTAKDREGSSIAPIKPEVNRQPSNPEDVRRPSIPSLMAQSMNGKLAS